MILQALKNMYPKSSEKVFRAVIKDLEKCRAQKQWTCREFTRSAKFGWQITGLYHSNCYACTDEILAGLGKMYVADERFKENIDKQGEGTAEFAANAIIVYTNSF